MLPETENETTEYPPANWCLYFRDRWRGIDQWIDNITEEQARGIMRTIMRVSPYPKWIIKCEDMEYRIYDEKNLHQRDLYVVVGIDPMYMYESGSGW